MNNLKPTHQDTEIFGKGIKLTRSTKFKTDELKEGEDFFFQGMFGTVGLIGTALAWLIGATIFNYAASTWFIFYYFSWACIGLAVTCVVVWALIYVPKKPFKDAFKWVVNNISKPFKWFINLPIA